MNHPDSNPIGEYATKSRGASILLVEDDSVKRYLVTRQLRAAGFTVLEAHSGAQALRLAQDDPALIILDEGLPDLPGHVVARRLKEDVRTALIPIIQLSTSFVDADAAVRGLTSGAEAYLRDTLEPEVMIATIHALLRARGALAQRATILERISDGYFEVDTEWRFTYLNPQAEGRIRRPKHELLGRLMWDVWPSIIGTRFEREYRAAVATGKPVEFEEYLAEFDQWFEIRAYPFDGGLSAFFRDVTERKRLAQALEQSEGELRRLADSSMLGVVRWHVDGHVTQANQALLDMLGVTEADLEAGHINWRALALDEASSDDPATRELQAEGSTRPYEKQLVRKDGKKVDVLVGGTFLEGERDRGISFVLDISERKRAEWRSNQLTLVASALSRALMPEDVIKTILGALKGVGATTSVVRLLDADGRHLRIVALDSKFEPEVRQHEAIDLAQELPLTAAVKQRATLWIEDLEQLKASWPRMLSMNIAATQAWVFVPLLIEDRVLGTLTLTFPKPTKASPEEKAFLEALASLCAQALERSRLYEQARKATLDARVRAEFAERFVGIVSHDLRSPLQVISFAAAVLSRGDLDDRRLQAVQRIVSANARAGRMIHDLLDFTQAQLGGGIPIQRVPVDLAALASEQVEDARSIYEARAIQLKCEGDLAGRWDADRLRQILTNLLGNAVQHGDPAAPIEVDLQDKGAQVVLRVSNRGKPLPPDVLPHLFDAFRRSSGRSTNPDRSLGLGLFITRAIVQAHGGHVEAQSSEDGKIAFVAYLPRE